ncbi:MAG: hypothetical protein ACLGHL_09830 [Actinomycetota bacterium]
MDLSEASWREKSRTFFGAIALALVVAVLAPPVVQAAITRVRGTVTAKIKDSTGGTIDAAAIDRLGLFVTDGPDGAVAVRNFAGGGGFIGAADCAAGGLPDTVTVPNNGVGEIVTGIIVTGTDAAVQLSSEATDALLGVPEGADFPVSTFRVNANHPNEFVGLGNGLTITAPLKVKCTGTNGQVVVLGQ